MQITLQNNDDNSGQLTLVLESTDYKDSFQRELKKKAGKMQIKGFRKGKAPVAMVSKIYGQSIFYDLINQMISEQLNEYIQENNLDLIGNPLPVEDQEMYDFNPQTNQTMTFRFELGWFPAFDLQGISNEDVYTIYEPEVSDADVDAEMSEIRMRAAQPSETDGPVALDDMIDVEATEISSEDPYSCTFKVRIEDIKDETLRNSLLGKSKGYSFEFDIYELEKLEKTQVRKYILKLEEDDDRDPSPMFKGIVLGVFKKKPADMDEEFLSRFFGESTKTEEQAREMLREYIADSQNASINGLLFTEIQKALMEKNPMKLSNSFLEKMIKHLNKEGEKISSDIEAYKEALIWMRMRDKIVEEEKIEIKEEELDRHFRLQVYNYFGGAEYAFSIMDDMVKRMRSNQKMVNEAYHKILDEKVFFAIKERISLEKKNIALSAFKTLLETQKANAELAETAEA
jgi:trigger factor